MANFVSTLFNTPQEFEDFLKSLDFADKTAIGTINAERIAKWDKKACYMSVSNGKLNLYFSAEETAENLLCSIDICSADNVTTRRDAATGALTVIGWKDNTSGEIYKLWVGTIEAYRALSSKDSKTVYFATNANDVILELQSALSDVREQIAGLRDDYENINQGILDIRNELADGSFVVKNAENAATATNAANATKAEKTSFSNSWQSGKSNETKLTESGTYQIAFIFRNKLYSDFVYWDGANEADKLVNYGLNLSMTSSGYEYLYKYVRVTENGFIRVWADKGESSTDGNETITDFQYRKMR